MNYIDERFADIQMLRYRLKNFDRLSLKQKEYIYYLSEATTAGRDIIFDQNCRINLAVRKALEYIYLNFEGDRATADFKAVTDYLKQVWFANGIHHHYNCDKFRPSFSREYLQSIIENVSVKDDCSKANLDILYLIHDDDKFPKRVNQAEGEDLVQTSACNFYENVTQQEVEDFYNAKKSACPESRISWGLNSKVEKINGKIQEVKWNAEGMYGKEIQRIIYWLEKAQTVCENQSQHDVISLLIDFYKKGDLNKFDEYSIAWVKQHEGMIDFINGFIEVYGDPLGMKGTWEGLVHYVDTEATNRTTIISQNALWFERNSPVDEQFKRETVAGVSAKVVIAAMLGGEEYPSTAIGINLPNANWIRAEHGSKSITIGNLTEAYSEASKGNGFRKEFINDERMLQLIDKYGNLTDDLHTDLHECLGHGSGKLLPSTDPDALKAYGNTIEEARADLFALYYIADKKMLELGLLNDEEAYKANYYTYMLNGLLTQTVRIKLGSNIEEAHMRNRSLIAWWVIDHAKGCVELKKDAANGKTFLYIHDYEALRKLFGQLLREIQRIKSEGDYQAASQLVETYAVKINRDLHAEVISRYEKLNIAPYRGFINPRFILQRSDNGDITDIQVDYTETYEHQMLRYGGYCD